MNQSAIAEVLVDLYLRLNGYLTSGLIVHSSTWGQAATEIDRIGIRHPFHSQNDREVATSKFLRVLEGITDCLICEVKSDSENVGFNPSISNNNSLIEYALNWLGILPNEQSSEIADRLGEYFSLEISEDAASEGLVVNGVRFRALLCCPTIDQIDSAWFLGGNEIFAYLNLCFNPTQRREGCSTRYNFNQWGYPHAKLVRAFKDGHVKNFSELSNYIACA